MQHTTQSERQRNKLHKPADPRGHNYTDSGVAMTSPTRSTWRGPDEAIGGGTYVRDHTIPTAPLESIRTDLDTTSPLHEAERNARFSSSKDRDLDRGVTTGTTGGLAGATANNKSYDDKIESRGQNYRLSGGDSAPYWGNLPKGEDGGLYNTVAGHGSAADDHAEHHHMPAKGGVYNTVVGHGSQDPESARHSQPRGLDTTGSREDSMLAAAPLTDIPEERNRTSRQVASGATQDTTPGLLPETSVRDDVLLAEAASRDTGRTGTQRRADSPSQRAFPLAAGQADERESRRHSGSPSRYGAVAGAAAVGAAGAAAADNVGKRRRGSSAVDADRSRSPSLGNRHQAATVVGGQRRSSRQRSPVAKTRSHEEEGSPKGEKKHKILGIFHRNKDETGRRKSISHPTESTREGVSPNRLRKLSKGEAAMERRASPPSPARADVDEHSGHGKEKAAVAAAAGAGALGFAHHRREDSISENPRELRNSISSPITADAGGAGPAGEAPRQVEGVSTPFEHPREPPMPPPHGAEAGHGHGDYTMLASSGAPARETTRRDVVGRDQGDYNVIASSGAPHPEATRKDVVAREAGDHNIIASSGVPAPERTRKDVSSSESGDYNTLRSSGSPSAEKTRSGSPGQYNTLPSGIPSGVKLGPAIAGAAIAGTEKHRDHSKTSKSNTDEEGAEYNVLASGTPFSSVTHGDSQSGHGQYNTLASGTASGIHPSQTQRDSDITSRAQDLKDLPSLTHPLASMAPPLPLRPCPSPLTPAAPTPTPTPARTPSRASPPTPPPDGAKHEPRGHADAYTSSAPRQGQQQQQHTGRGQSGLHMSPEAASTEQYPPTQQMAKGMSPEVMPSAYTASAPRASHTQGQGYGQSSSTEQYPPTQHMAMGMSPQVMPDAYTASSAARQQSQGQGQGYGQQQQQQPQIHALGFDQLQQQPQQTPQPYQPQPQYQQQQQPQFQSSQAYPQTQQGFAPQQQQQPYDRSMKERNIDHALAAATSSWAATAGKSSGVGSSQGQSIGQGQQGVGQGFGQGQGIGGMGQGQEKMRCQHCGGENDISGYLERFKEGLGLGERKY
ncbi:hypothetical protein NEMBOFW57_009338 [Staphylotrichum longicolle]|uniref:Uncharacterized protein n=1 Tax=Staphylotrichum longicolle TaxID=669026 RepID=A0AAD4ENW7_9PEZI|nr:hypothetical protein NEMBOFW57_009338 [Staphylotrichum longicolle]